MSSWLALLLLGCGSPSDPAPFARIPLKEVPELPDLPCDLEVVEEHTVPGIVAEVAVSSWGVVVAWAGPEASGVEVGDRRVALPARPTSLAIDGDAIWVATDGGGVWRVDGIPQVVALADEVVVDLAPSPQGWLALTGSGTVSTLQGGEVWDAQGAASRVAWLDGPVVTRVVGGLAAASDEWTWMPLPAAPRRTRSPSVVTRIEAADGWVWIPLPERGLARWNPEQGLELEAFWPGSGDVRRRGEGYAIAMFEGGVGVVDADGALVSRCALPGGEPVMRIAVDGEEVLAAAGSRWVRYRRR